MKILIETNGYAKRTKISINGHEQKSVTEFNFSVRSASPPAEGKCKMVLVRRGEGGAIEPCSLYAGDFEKYDLDLKPDVPAIGE